MIINYITVDEISEILDELEVEYEVELDDKEENEDPFITCVMSEEPFNIVPLGQGPFYEEFLLRRGEVQLRRQIHSAAFRQTDLAVENL